MNRIKGKNIKSVHTIYNSSPLACEIDYAAEDENNTVLWNKMMFSNYIQAQMLRLKDCNESLGMEFKPEAVGGVGSHGWAQK